MMAALRNHIRNVEPPLVLINMISAWYRKFVRMKKSATECKSPLPPLVEKRVAALLVKADKYKATPVPNTDMMTWEVQSLVNPAITRTVTMPLEAQTPPSCCVWSKNGDGLPCYHGCAVIREKHGNMNVHKFVAYRHTTEAWKELYEGLEFPLPPQNEIDDAMIQAELLVASGNALHGPKALPPPRGRPVKNAGIRKRSWYEQGPSGNTKRAYTCSLCSQPNHTRKDCPLKQVFDDMPED